MARPEALEQFIQKLREHAEANPNEDPAFFTAAMVDPDTGRVWFCQHVLVSEEALPGIYDAIERGAAVDPDEQAKSENEAESEEA
jgi:hypothetical protein